MGVPAHRPPPHLLGSDRLRVPARFGRMKRSQKSTMSYILDNRFFIIETGEEIVFKYPIDAEEGVAEGWVRMESADYTEPEPMPEPEHTKPPVVMEEEEEATSTLEVHNVESEAFKSTSSRKPPRRRARA